MCDYSLEQVASRPASVGDKLTVSRFTSGGTTGFKDKNAENETAVCLLPGAELAFDSDIATREGWGNEAKVYEGQRVAKFIQIDPEARFQHHDAIELLDGTKIRLNDLVHGLEAHVLQLPAVSEVSHVELPAGSETAEPNAPVAAPDLPVAAIAY